MLKVIGVMRSNGEFENDKKENVKYDNIVLHCIQPMEKEKEGEFKRGCICKTVKVKNDIDVITKLFGCVMSKNQFTGLIDKSINAYYDENKHPILIQPIGFEFEKLK